jgi:hypothetical protein
MTYRIDRGGQTRTVKGAGARRKMEQLAHGAAVAVDVQRAPVEHADWFYDLRRKRLYIYGGLLRYIDAAVAQGANQEDLLRIPQWIGAYIEDQFGPQHTGELRIVA